MKKLAVLLAATLGTLLLLEGALSLFLGTSLRRWFEPRPAQEPAQEDGPFIATDHDRALAAAHTEGPLRVADDPLVAYTFKTGSALTYTEGKVTMQFTTDELGLRARAGPPPAEDTPRIVVLGDSVAFGFGLADEETLAAQLERVLGGRVACYTVAVPSWNARNAWRFLLDHLDKLHPDVVLYMPVENDLEDGYGVTEAGQRRVTEDPGSSEPLLHLRAARAFVTLRTRELHASGDDPAARLGPAVIGSRLGALARARLTDMARTIADGAARLARSGAKLALVPYERSDFQRELRAECLRAGAAPVEIALLDELRKDDTLGIDPHPSAATVTAFATWIADSLFALGWLPGDGRGALPALDGRYADRRAEPSVDAEAEGWSSEQRARLERELEPRISPETLQGILQVYGGLNLDRTLEARFAAVLPRGKTLRVRLAPVDGRPDLYPLDVRVLADERALGTVRVSASGEAAGTFELPPLEAAFDVRLEADDWAVVTVRGKSWVASARLVELESLP